VGLEKLRHNFYYGGDMDKATNFSFSEPTEEVSSAHHSLPLPAPRHCLVFTPTLTSPEKPKQFFIKSPEVENLIPLASDSKKEEIKS